MGRKEKGHRQHWAVAALFRSCVPGELVLFLAELLSGTFAGQRLFHSAFGARLQIEGVTFDFLDDVLGLHLALEPAQCILDRLSFLQSNFCQTYHLQTSPG